MGEMFLYHRCSFIPNYQTEDESVSIETLTLQVKQKQKDELRRYLLKNSRDSKPPKKRY